jgi:hypothetical protein
LQSGDTVQVAAAIASSGSPQTAPQGPTGQSGSNAK